MEKYGLASFLHEYLVKEEDYKRTYTKWLSNKASAHYKRDKKYFAKHKPSRPFLHTNEEYKIGIHKAVLDSNGKDYYTGKDLDWGEIGKWDSEVRIGRINDLPTVDHINREDFDEKIEFVICSWAVNDAKSDLSIEDFLRLCKDVVEYSKERKATDE